MLAVLWVSIAYYLQWTFEGAVLFWVQVLFTHLESYSADCIVMNCTFLLAKEFPLIIPLMSDAWHSSNRYHFYYIYNYVQIVKTRTFLLDRKLKLYQFRVCSFDSTLANWKFNLLRWSYVEKISFSGQIFIIPRFTSFSILCFQRFNFPF